MICIILKLLQANPKPCPPDLEGKLSGDIRCVSVPTDHGSVAVVGELPGCTIQFNGGLPKIIWLVVGVWWLKNTFQEYLSTWMMTSNGNEHISYLKLSNTSF